MLYDGLFSRPAGLICSSFDEARHKIPRIAIPPEWPRFLGLDFGGVNTAGIYFAQERDAYHKPTGRLFAYGRHLWGQSCLLARRLAEAGAGVITIDALENDRYTGECFRKRFQEHW